MLLFNALFNFLQNFLIVQHHFMGPQDLIQILTDLVVDIFYMLFYILTNLFKGLPKAFFLCFYFRCFDGGVSGRVRQCFEKGPSH